MRALVAIDPGETSGVSVWVLELRLDLGAILPWRLAHCVTVRIGAAGFTQADGVALLAELVPAEASWFALVERPFNPSGPTVGERWWRDVLDLLARRRAAVAEARFRKPTILRPRASQWRAPLGIRTRSLVPRAQRKDRSAPDLKDAAIAYLRTVLQLDVRQPDAAESACLGVYGTRAANLGAASLGGRPKTITWVP